MGRWKIIALAKWMLWMNGYTVAAFILAKHIGFPLEATASCHIACAILTGFLISENAEQAERNDDAKP